MDVRKRNPKVNFLIAKTFTESLEKLTGAEQKVVKITTFDLQMNPSRPGLSFHRIKDTRDTNFWSVKVNQDIRLIVHRTDSSLLLVFVGHHDTAYRWAERRQIGRHPKTGAAQIVEVREIVRENEVSPFMDSYSPATTHRRSRIASPEPKYSRATANIIVPKPKLFGELSDDQLLHYGVPQQWLDEVRGADEDSLLDLTEHLPDEASEALLEIATGSVPVPALPVPSDQDPFTHPDARRRFRIIENVEELERALEYPWEKWTVFLHPAQYRIVEQKFNGPARVAGSAGTGKTIVALHRAVHLARTHHDARVLLVTFSDTLANSLSAKLRRLIGNQPAIGERLEVHAMSAIGWRLYERNFGRPDLATDEQIRKILEDASAEVEGHRFRAHFLWTEWNSVVDAWQLESWEEYRDVVRLGRKTRLAESQRVILWFIFSKLRTVLDERGLLTEPALFRRLERHFTTTHHTPFDFCVIDEAQDIGVPELRFLAAIGGEQPDSLFFSGDLGQRIFRTPFSWRMLGVDVRGRSQTLRVNYRTSHQIRRQADCLLPEELSDVDGVVERRDGTISVFNGAEPGIEVYGSQDEECAAIAEWIVARLQEGYAPNEIGVFVRSEIELARANEAVKAAGMTVSILDERSDVISGKVSVGTMHLAKGMEFRAVVVAACDDDVLPLQARIESIANEGDLADAYETERHLLYVACTRARDHLLITGVEPASEFLDDLRPTE